MTNPKVSLVIPAYNRERLLGELLNNASEQTVPYEEIIVVDDGSSDGTEQYVSQNFPNVRYIKTPNRGVQHARNTGIEAATTEWITLCDSDDLLDVGYNEQIANILSDDPSLDQVYSNFRFFNENGEQPEVFARLPAHFFSEAKVNDEYITKVPDLLDKVLINQFLWPSGMTIRKTAIEHVGYFDTNMRHVKSEDLEFTLRAIAKLNIALNRQPMVKIRKHGANQSADSVKQIMGEITVLHKFMENSYYGYFKRFVLQQSIARRSEGLITGLYDRQQFADIVTVFQSGGPVRWSFKSRLKYTIAGLPLKSLRLQLWRITKKLG